VPPLLLTVALGIATATAEPAPPQQPVPPGHVGPLPGDPTSGPAGEAPLTVRLAVSSLTGTEDLTLRAFARWGDEDRQLVLTDDGSTPGDLPQDGIWVGLWTGPTVDALHMRLVLERTAQPPLEVYQGLERVRGPEDRLSWALDLGATTGQLPEATRISAPYIARRLPETDATSMAASVGWLGFLGIWLAVWGDRRWGRS